MRIFILLLATLPFIAISQITVNQSDMPEAGDTIRSSATVDWWSIDFEETGEDFSWDFTSFTPYMQQVDTFVSVTSTPWIYQILFLFSANLAQQEAEFAQFEQFQVTDSYRYFKNSSSAYKEVGFGVSLNGLPLPNLYEDADVIYKFPMETGNIDSSLSNYEFSIPGIAYYGGWKKRVNVVDGWGEVSTPYGTFQALRLRSEVSQYDSLHIDSLGFGIPIYRETTEYKWLGNGLGLPIVHVIDNGLITTVTYLDSVRTLLPVSDVEVSEHLFHVFPNPLNDILHIETDMPAGTNYRLEIVTMQGKNVFYEEGQSPGNLLTVYLNRKEIGPGTYVLRMMGNGKVMSSKIMIQ